MPSPESPDATPATARPLTAVLRWARRLVGGRAPQTSQEGWSEGLLDALPDPVLVVDAEDRIQAVNRAAHETFGLSADSLLGDGLGDTLFGKHDLEAYRDHRRRVLDAAPASEPGEDSFDEPPRLAVVHADGSEVPVALTLRPIPGTDGTRFAVTLRDARAVQADAIDGRRRTLRTILDTLPDAVVAIDHTGRVLFRNRAAGGHRDQTPGALPEPAWRAAEAVMRAGEPAVGEEAVGTSGGVRLTTRIPVRSASGAVVGLVAFSRDVTAEKADHARMLDAKRAAEAAAQANGEVLATTSHEIRTLMSGVTGMTQLLLGTDLDEGQRDYVETIRTSGATLLRVVNDVLDLSKMDAGMLALEREPFAVATVVEGALAGVVHQAGQKGVALSSDLAVGVPPTVPGDAGRVQQVLANLLTNAVKFTDEGAVGVRVEMAPGGRALAFAVQDTGVGIAPDRLDAVFEKFVQADASTSRTHGGTGLGLAICRRLVEQMGGELTAESVPGGGSVFRFTIALEEGPADTAPALSEAPAPAAAPLTDHALMEQALTEQALTEQALTEQALTDHALMDQAVTEQAWVARPQAVAPAAPLVPAASVAAPVAPPPEPLRRRSRPEKSKVMETVDILPAARVLLVEDDPVMQKVTSHTLLRLGYRPTVVSNGSQGVIAVRGKPYDVVLMDIMMPVMDGLEATRTIREDHGPHPEPAIVMLTANAMKNDRQAGYDAGCDAYLTKPVDARELAATIERAIRERTEAGAAEQEAVEADA